jgi:hypothetical protein
MITKHKVETFIVPRLGVAFPATPGTTTLWNPTTDADLLAVGGFAFYEPVVGSGNPVSTLAAMTVTNTPSFKVIHRRDESQDLNPLQPRKYIQTGEIKTDCLISAKGASARLKNNGCWIIGDLVGNAGQVPVADETEYMINAALRGWRTDVQNGYNTPLKMGRFTTPDYTLSTIYTTTSQQVDHILGNVAFDFNSGSPADIVAICINSGATANTANGDVTTITAAAALTVGATIIIGYTNAGQPIRLTVDAQLIQMFNLLISVYGLAGTEQIVPYALATANNLGVANRNITGGRVAASATTDVDRLLFVSLNKKLAFYDEVFQTKERVNVGLDGGFGQTTLSERALSTSEGQGYGRELAQYYSDMFGNRLYPGGKKWQPNSVRYSNEVQENAIYDVYVIEYCANRTATSGLLSVSPQRIIIAIINTTIGSAVTNPFFTGVANPQKTYIETRLNTWMPTTGFPYTALAL